MVEAHESNHSQFPLDHFGNDQSNIYSWSSGNNCVCAAPEAFGQFHANQIKHLKPRGKGGGPTLANGERFAEAVASDWFVVSHINMG